jgi:hypothetical protein
MLFAGTPTRSWLQWLLVAFTVGLAAAVALSMALGSESDAATTQTKSFSTAQPIFRNPGTGTGKATPYPSSIPVSFPKGSRILDVNVTLRSFASANPDDVSVMVAHKQTNQGVMSDTGGTVDVTNATFTLDDEATVALPDTTQIVSTRYKPARYGADWPAPAPSALSVFDGESPNGTWRLFVVDDGFGAEPLAFNDGWTLRIKVRLP